MVMAHLLCIIGGIALILFGLLGKTGFSNGAKYASGQAHPSTTENMALSRVITVSIGCIAAAYGAFRFLYHP